MVDAQAEHQITNYQTTFGQTNSFAGTYLGTSGYIQPKWKATLFSDYRMDNWTFHYDLQYIGGTNDAGGGVGYGYTLPDIVYHNISVAYALPAMGPAKGALLSVGINNLFDKDPPFTVEDGVGKNNTISGPYDEVGRFFYTRLSLKF
jgi:outer membrane receptor protein involved in Fe transport